jgi:predicted ATPase
MVFWEKHIYLTFTFQIDKKFPRMITRLEAKNYKSLQFISLEVKPLQILIGPNASGKSTFLDVIMLLGDVVKYGVKKAVEIRSQNFLDLTFQKRGGAIEFAIELRPPFKYGRAFFGLASEAPSPANVVLRYELKIEQNGNERPMISGERLLFLDKNKEAVAYSKTDYPIETVFQKITNKEVYQSLITRSANQMVSVRSLGAKNSLPGFELDQDKAGLSFVPENLEKFSEHIWLRKVLSQSVKRISLDGEVLRKASNPGQGLDYAMNGSNLPWVIENMKENYPDLFIAWLNHVKIGLPEIMNIVIQTVPDLNQRYIQIQYKNGIPIPSWLISDGTLRFLALTVLAYLPNDKGLYLIEEPENGVHPKILETVYQSLSSVYDTQIMLATHSPIFLTISGDKDLLLFKKDEHGSTVVSTSKEHPYLKDWRHKIDLGIIFASGVLG